MAGTRSFVAGSFALNLDGVACGFVKSAEGGDAYSNVVETNDAASAFTQKRIGGVKYDDINLSIGFGLAQDLYDWIAASWKMNYSRKDGSIVATDLNGNAKSEREFFHALISEVTIPALDASSKSAGFLEVKVAPEYTRDRKAAGKVTSPKSTVPKQFITSGFRLELGKLPCEKVMKIESFTVTQEIKVDAVGDVRDVATEPGKLEFPNLQVTMAAANAADAWFAWFEDFVINGKNTADQELNGTIIFLAPDQAELGRVNLFNVGIFRLRTINPAGEHAERLEAHLYCERMELQIAKPKPKPAPVPVGVLKPVLPRPIAPKVGG